MITTTTNQSQIVPFLAGGLTSAKDYISNGFKSLVEYICNGAVMTRDYLSRGCELADRSLTENNTLTQRIFRSAVWMLIGNAVTSTLVGTGKISEYFLKAGAIFLTGSTALKLYQLSRENTTLRAAITAAQGQREPSPEPRIVEVLDDSQEDSSPTQAALTPHSVEEPGEIQRLAGSPAAASTDSTREKTSVNPIRVAPVSSSNTTRSTRKPPNAQRPWK